MVVEVWCTRGLAAFFALRPIGSLAWFTAVERASLHSWRYLLTCAICWRWTAPSLHSTEFDSRSLWLRFSVLALSVLALSVLALSVLALSVLALSVLAFLFFLFFSFFLCSLFVLLVRVPRPGPTVARCSRFHPAAPVFVLSCRFRSCVCARRGLVTAISVVANNGQ